MTIDNVTDRIQFEAVLSTDAHMERALIPDKRRGSLDRRRYIRAGGVRVACERVANDYDHYNISIQAHVITRRLGLFIARMLSAPDW